MTPGAKREVARRRAARRRAQPTRRMRLSFVRIAQVALVAISALMVFKLWRQHESSSVATAVYQPETQTGPTVEQRLEEQAYKADLVSVAGRLREQVVVPQPRILYPVDPHNVPQELSQLWNQRLGELVEQHDDPWISRDLRELVLSGQFGLGVKTIDMGDVFAAARLKTVAGRDIPFMYFPQYALNSPGKSPVLNEDVEHESRHDWQMWVRAYPIDFFRENQVGTPGAFKAYCLGNAEMYAYEFQARYCTRAGYLARHPVVRAFQLGKPELAVNKFLETAHLGVPWLVDYCIQVEQGAHDYLRQAAQASESTQPSAAHLVVGGRFNWQGACLVVCGRGPSPPGQPA